MCSININLAADSLNLKQIFHLQFIVHDFLHIIRIKCCTIEYVFGTNFTDLFIMQIR